MMLVLFDCLPYQSEPLLVRLCHGRTLVRSELIRTEPGYPHVPVAL